MHHGGFSRTHLTVVQTEYEVNRTIIGGCSPMQVENLVFCTLTVDREGLQCVRDKMSIRSTENFGPKYCKFVDPSWRIF